MKLIRNLFCAAAAVILAMAAGNAQVVINDWYPPMTLNISGVITGGSNIGGDYGSYTEWDSIKTRFATKDLIKLLNQSGTFTNVLYDVTGVMQIPAGSYLKIDINQPVILSWGFDWALFVTNRNGFSFQLNSIYDPVQEHYYTFMDIYHDFAVVSCKFTNTTAAGHEFDTAAVHFTFNNGEGAVFEFFGAGDFRWSTAPKKSSISQRVNVAAKIIGGGNFAFQDKAAVMQAILTAKGSGITQGFQPFQMWDLYLNKWDPTLGIPPLMR